MALLLVISPLPGLMAWGTWPPPPPGRGLLGLPWLRVGLGHIPKVPITSWIGHYPQELEPGVAGL